MAARSASCLCRNLPNGFIVTLGIRDPGKAGREIHAARILEPVASWNYVEDTHAAFTQSAALPIYICR